MLKPQKQEDALMWLTVFNAKARFEKKQDIEADPTNGRGKITNFQIFSSAVGPEALKKSTVVQHDCAQSN